MHDYIKILKPSTERNINLTGKIVPVTRYIDGGAVFIYRRKHWSINAKDYIKLDNVELLIHIGRKRKEVRTR